MMHSSFDLQLYCNDLAQPWLQVERAWETACQEPLQERICLPEACKPFMAEDNLRPFSIKHAQQQASIVGNLEAEGLLSCLPHAAILEVCVMRHPWSKTCMALSQQVVAREQTSLFLPNPRQPR